MHTLIINFHPDIKSWNLVEPFWYHLQNDPGLIVLQPRTTCSQMAGNLLNEIRGELEHYSSPEFQLVFIAELHLKENIKRLSLSEQLRGLQDNIIEPLKERGQKPNSIWIIAIDGEGRATYGQPMPAADKIPWEIDRLGYLEGCTDDAISHLYFLSSDFDSLDAAWGGTTELTRADLRRNDSGSEFMDLQSTRKMALLRGLDEVLAAKLASSQARIEISHASSCINAESLLVLRRDFELDIEEAVKPSGIGNQLNFQPSAALKKLLPKHFGLECYGREMRILRLEASSAEQDMPSLLVRCAWLITAIVSIGQQNRSDWMTNLAPGKVYQVEIKDFEARLDAIMRSYAFCLEKASERLKIQALIEKSWSVKYTKENTDYITESALIGDLQTDFQPIKLAHNYLDLGKWQADCKRVADRLLTREEQIRISMNHDIDRLKIMQRVDNRADREVADIENYYQELVRKQSEKKQAMSDSYPFKVDAVEEWKIYTEQIDTRMDYLLSTRPRIKDIVNSITVAVVILMFAYVASGQRVLELPVLWKWLLIPAVMIFMTLGFALYSRWQVARPIHALLYQIQNKVAELCELQNGIAEQCISYLGLINNIFWINKEILEVGQQKKAHVEENKLRQYHLLKLRQHRESLETLMTRLGFPGLMGTDYALYNNQYSFIEDNIDNQTDWKMDTTSMWIYSPVKCQQKMERDSTRVPWQIELGGGVKEVLSMPPWAENQITIRVREDEVFSL